MKGLRFDRQPNGHFVVYQYGKWLGEITPDGRRSPSPDANTLKRAVHELERRGLLHAAYASRMTRATRRYQPAFLASLDRARLRRALWLLRRQDARPHEANPAAAQYDGLATAAAVRAEYRRRGWKVPPPTKGERP